MPRFWAVLVAAGAGQRMKTAQPKQYLLLRGRPVLNYALDTLLASSRISQVVTVLSPHDQYWEVLCAPHYPTTLATVTGGAHRMHSVLAGIQYFHAQAEASDWVLVHDAARPCLQAQDLESLFDALTDESDTGALLACPVSDSILRSNTQGVMVEAVDRTNLWRAMTPQIFRYKLLHDLLANSIQRHRLFNDEASAVLAAGIMPKLVLGSSDNIKITHPDDLAHADAILARH